MTVTVPPPPPAGRGRGRVLAGVAVALGALLLVGLVAVAVVWLRGDERPPVARGPTPADPGTTPDAGDPADGETRDPADPGGTAGPGERGEPPATAPAPAPGDPRTPSSPLPGERPDGIDEIVEQVAGLRGLPVTEPLDARAVTPDDLAAKVTALAFADYEDDEIAFDQRLLVALRLLDPDDDLRATIEDLYGAQVLGLYVVEERVLYIGAEEPRLTPAQRITAAHEVLHALQDLAFDLDALMDIDDGDSDGQLARLALVEGDAMLTQELWSLQHQSAQERQEAQRESLAHSPDALLRAPAYVRESLLFPYTQGSRFVEELLLEGGFAAVDAAFADPPASTRHVLRPETYLAGERHRGTTVTTSPGDGWEEASAYTFGEFDLDQWLAPLGAERARVTAGWDGGQTRHWHRGGDDAVAMALRLSTPEAADAACGAAPAWYAAAAGGEERPGSGQRAAGQASGGLLEGDRDWMAYTCTEVEVVVGLGPDAPTAERLAGR